VNAAQPAPAELQNALADQQNRIQQLWEKRTSGADSRDYPLGPGDVLKISCPGVEELRDREVRIGGDGTFSLPLIGTIHAAGETEQQLQNELKLRLSQYMYQPQIDLFAKEYRSRQVAIIGAVAKPGLYDLSSGSDSLFNMISQAGGMGPEAAQRVLFLPAEDSRVAQAGSNPQERLRTIQPALLSQEGVSSVLRNRSPVTIDLNKMNRGAGEGFLALPARPGDIIVIPHAGEVLVQGWVDKPGDYKITPGLTVLGAVAAAGGRMFAASDDVVVVRSISSGSKELIKANLAEIARGTQADIPVEEGDVVAVDYSTLKIVPYGLYSLIGKGIYMGASMPVF
jgi:polysaccharide export outer membrane protein